MTKSELSQYQDLKRELERDADLLEELESAAGPRSAPLTDLPRVPGISDRTGDYAVEIAELKDIISERYHRCLAERSRLERFISSVDDSLMRQVLSMRYVRGQSWQQIAPQFGDSYSAESLRKVTERFWKKQETT